MTTGELGKKYSSGEIIIRQGDVGDCMYVIQDGEVEVVLEHNGREKRVAVLNEGEFFGEMSIFEQEVRSATVRALGEVRVLTVDKKNFLRRINQDPSIAFRLVESLSRRIRGMNKEILPS